MRMTRKTRDGDHLGEERAPYGAPRRRKAMATEDTHKQAQRDIEVESRLTRHEARLESIEAFLPTLATKADLQALGLSNQADLQALGLKTQGDMEKLGSRLGGEIAELRVEMHKTDASIKTWMLANILAIIGTLLAALFGFNQISKNTAPIAAQPPVIINLPGVSNPGAVTPR
jgi:hypothetical protein